MTAIDKSSSRTHRAEQIVSPDTLKGRRQDPKTFGLGPHPDLAVTLVLNFILRLIWN